MSQHGDLPTLQAIVGCLHRQTLTYHHHDRLNCTGSRLLYRDIQFLCCTFVVFICPCQLVTISYMIGSVGIIIFAHVASTNGRFWSYRWVRIG